jgi:hypothetical protein
VQETYFLSGFYIDDEALEGRRCFEGSETCGIVLTNIRHVASFYIVVIELVSRIAKCIWYSAHVIADEQFRRISLGEYLDGLYTERREDKQFM